MIEELVGLCTYEIVGVGRRYPLNTPSHLFSRCASIISPLFSSMYTMAETTCDEKATGRVLAGC